VSVRIERRVSAHQYCTIALFILGTFAGAVAIGIALNAGTGPPRRGVGDGFVKYVPPMVVWWLSWLAALGLQYRLVLGARPVPSDRPAGHPIQLWGYTALPLILLLPVVTGVAQLAVSGDLPRLKLNLKLALSGADALSALFPNIYHSLWGLAVHVRLASWSLLERGSIGLGWAATALIVGTRAYKGAGWWTFGFCVFFALSLGPFLELAPGLDRGPVLPFWLLRYVPVMSEARVPSRWIALALVTASVLVGYGVQRIGARALSWSFLSVRVTDEVAGVTDFQPNCCTTRPCITNPSSADI
jgi:hypothetical protein